MTQRIAALCVAALLLFAACGTAPGSGPDDGKATLNAEDQFVRLDGEEWVPDLTDSAKAYFQDSEGDFWGLPFWENSVSLAATTISPFLAPWACAEEKGGNLNMTMVNKQGGHVYEALGAEGGEYSQRKSDSLIRAV